MVGNEIQIIDVHFTRPYEYASNKNKVHMNAISNPPKHTFPLVKYFYMIQTMF